MKTTTGQKTARPAVIALCGNPNCGKTTIFNAITGLSQHVGNYPGVTVEKVVGQFNSPHDQDHKLQLVDIPGTYSLSAFTPDEYIAASALFGEIKGAEPPDGIVAVIDATNLERGLYFLYQILEIGTPVVVVLNMIDLARKRGLIINSQKLSEKLGGIEVVEVVGNKGIGIDKLKEKIVTLTEPTRIEFKSNYDDATEGLLSLIDNKYTNKNRTRAQKLRIIFDVSGEAEKTFVDREGKEAFDDLDKGRVEIKKEFGALYIAETVVLTKRAQQLYEQVVSLKKTKPQTRSEKIDKVLLNPFIGPIFLVLMMMLVFQAIFSWAEPFMDIIDSFFSYISAIVENSMDEGPLRSLLTDGIIGGVGSVLIFIPQIAFLFIFIALLEDSGYMPRAAFLVDRMFRWCGLSGKSFIPMLSSFACAVPGIMATRTIEDRKLRLITIMVAPLMTCSARLPVYAIMIAAFIPYKTVLGIMNLQGLVLAMLYLLGIVVAVIVSFILNKTVFKTERGTFLMELPSYKIPTFKSLIIRVFNRVKSFIVRAGTVIMAITIVIWALSYYPRSDKLIAEYDQREEQVVATHDIQVAEIQDEITSWIGGNPPVSNQLNDIINGLLIIDDPTDLKNAFGAVIDNYSDKSRLLNLHYDLKVADLNRESQIANLANLKAGEQIRNSYFGIIGRKIEPLFEPLGWDWKITMSVLASFPAREVIIAVIGTIYNLGTDVDQESSSLVDKMRSAKWEEGDKIGQLVFTPAVALSIMVFFALCCQCGATLVTIKQETSSWKYPIGVFVYMTVLAYISAFVVYQIFNGVGL